MSSRRISEGVACEGVSAQTGASVREQLDAIAARPEIAKLLDRAPSGPVRASEPRRESRLPYEIRDAVDARQ